MGLSVAMRSIPRSRRVLLSELYVSIQGESTHVGKPCVFVRLARCPLRCSWCDSEFTFQGVTPRDIEEVALEVHRLGVRTVELTGGEPLIWPAAIPLMERLLALGHEVLLETSGGVSIAKVPPEVHTILDVKCPDSGESDANLISNFDHLQPSTEIKFVIASRADFDWAVALCQEHTKLQSHELLFSPAYGKIEPSDLVDWLLESGLDARFQLQAHKVIWPPDARGV